jgi:hypothetical protein
VIKYHHHAGPAVYARKGVTRVVRHLILDDLDAERVGPIHQFTVRKGRDQAALCPGIPNGKELVSHEHREPPMLQSGVSCAELCGWQSSR